MAVGLTAPEHLLPVKGVRLAACHSGIKADSGVDDLVLIELGEQSNIAAVFTVNKFCAAPVVISKQHLGVQNQTKYLLINSGNANAGTGGQGIQAAIRSCQCVADHGEAGAESVLPFSTGVIGQQLDVERIEHAVPLLIKRLAMDHWMDAARGIMTTDTLPKAISRQLRVNGETITITGMCKGSGMIKPDMATMLGYVFTDARITKDQLSECLAKVVEISFNSITVDGDTSTNDACVLVATGASEVEVDVQHDEFMQVLTEVFQYLAQSIVRDGEGATKFVEIKVSNARSSRDAKELAYTIAHSPLVKTALFASDANWGRILAAIGRAPVDSLQIDRIDLYLGEVCLIEKGLPHPDYSEQKGQQEMSKEEILIRVVINQGAEAATVWTTDLSYNYIKINAEYRS